MSFWQSTWAANFTLIILNGRFKIQPSSFAGIFLILITRLLQVSPSNPVEELAVSPWGKLELCILAGNGLFHLLFWVKLSHPFFIWNAASGNFIIMGGNYNEGSWSCRLIGFFTSTGPDLSRPCAANQNIWSWGQDKRDWRKKRVSG